MKMFQKSRTSRHLREILEQKKGYSSEKVPKSKCVEAFAEVFGTKVRLEQQISSKKQVKRSARRFWNNIKGIIKYEL